MLEGLADNSSCSSSCGDALEGQGETPPGRAAAVAALEGLYDEPLTPRTPSSAGGARQQAAVPAASARPTLGRVGSRCLANLQRGQARVAAALESESRRHQQALNHCNRRALRWGMHLERRDPRYPHRVASGDRSGAPKQHPVSWTPQGTLRLAFGRLGTVASQRSRESSRQLDACAVVAWAFREWQSQCLRQFRLQLQTMPRPASWCWLALAWDETPLRLRPCTSISSDQ